VPQLSSLLQEQTGLVTGGSSGIGESLAKALPLDSALARGGRGCESPGQAGGKPYAERPSPGIDKQSEKTKGITRRHRWQGMILISASWEVGRLD